MEYISFNFFLTETELPTPDADHSAADDATNADHHIKPHEKRALNFLVNEYLLNNDYKLTSVTFSEENENQVIFSHLQS